MKTVLAVVVVVGLNVALFAQTAPQCSDYSKPTGGTPWQNSNTNEHSNSRSGVSLPTLCEPTGPPPYCNGTGTSGCSYTWSYTTCQWVPSQPTTTGSPILIDTAKTGFALSNPMKGQYVTFDLQGNGKPIKLSWPVEGSGNAWLAYDRDGDGVIKDGTELFGNYSPHSLYPDMPRMVRMVLSRWIGTINTNRAEPEMEFLTRVTRSGAS